MLRQAQHERGFGRAVSFLPVRPELVEGRFISTDQIGDLYKDRVPTFCESFSLCLCWQAVVFFSLTGCASGNFQMPFKISARRR